VKYDDLIQEAHAMPVVARLKNIPRGLLVVAAVLVVPFLIWLGFGLNNVAQSLWWHRRNGNKVVFQGHTILLPPMWRPVDGAGPAVLNLDRAVLLQPPLPLKVDTENMSIGAGGAGPGLISEAAASRWQTHMVASYREQGSYANPEVLHGKTMTFYCFDRDDGPIHGACFLCTAVGTNWQVIFAAGQTTPNAIQEKMREAKEVLKSIE
jgi:hypothetical protein